LRGSKSSTQNTSLNKLKNCSTVFLPSEMSVFQRVFRTCNSHCCELCRYVLHEASYCDEYLLREQLPTISDGDFNTLMREISRLDLSKSEKTTEECRMRDIPDILEDKGESVYVEAALSLIEMMDNEEEWHAVQPGVRRVSLLILDNPDVMARIFTRATRHFADIIMTMKRLSIEGTLVVIQKCLEILVEREIDNDERINLMINIERLCLDTKWSDLGTIFIDCSEKDFHYESRNERRFIDLLKKTRE
jgi:hypothetical protein